MQTEIIKVYYGGNALPYKDRERTVHFPITGSTFVGSSDTTKIRFYVDGYLADENALWISVSKRADGTQGSQFLTSGTDENGDKYREMTLSGWYTEKKGDLYISLKGYQGGSTGYWDEDTGMYVVEGVPVIRATGSIKLAINYAPVGEYPYYQDEMAVFQDIVAQLGNKLNITSGIKVVSSTSAIIVGSEEEGQLFYSKADKKLYQLVSGNVVVFFETYDKDTLDTKFGEKVDKLFTNGTKVYSHNGFTQGEIGVSETLLNAGGTIPQRTSGGQLNVSTPTDNSHATSKSYVDNSIDSAKSFLLGKINDTGHRLALVSKPNYVFDIQLLDGSNNVLNYVSLDLPTESIVVSGSYDEDTKSIVLTLENGSTINIPVGDLVEGLVDEQALQQALQPYVKELEVSSVLTTNDLLTNVGTNKDFVLDNMGEPLLCYISEDSGTYTISFFGKDRSFHAIFSENTLVINLLNGSTLDIDYLPIIELSLPMQTLTSSQMQVANQDNSVIKYSNRIYHKCNVGESSIEFVSVDYDIVDEGANQKLTKYEITVNKTTGATNMITSYVSFYSSGEIDSKLEEYAKVDGNYQTMRVGQADSLYSDREIQNADQACPPITFGPVGGTAEIKTGFNNFEDLRGNTVKWIQLFRTTDQTSTELNGITYSRNATTGVITVSGTSTSDSNFNIGLIPSIVSTPTKQDHKYLLKWNLTGTTPTEEQCTTNMFATSGLVGTDRIYNGGSNNSTYGQLNIKARATVDFSIQPQIFDLTAIYGAGNEPTIENIVDFYNLFPLPHYEYNAGQLLSSKSSALDSIWCNQFQTLNEYIEVIAGRNYEISGISAGGYIEEYDGAKNLIKTSEEITSTSLVELSENTHFVKVQATTSTDIMFRIYWDEDDPGLGNVPYQQYEKQTVTLPNIELRNVGSVYDVIYSSGGGKRRIGFVDLGSLTWEYSQGSGSHANTFRALLPSASKYVAYGTKPNMNTDSKYEVVSLQANEYNGGTDNTITYRGNSYIQIQDTSFGTDATALKNSLSGKYLYYELAEETDITEQENPGWTKLVKTDNMGTLKFVSSQAIQVPQAYFIRYTVSLTEWLDSAYAYSDGTPEKLALKSYVDEKISEIPTGDFGFTIFNSISNNTLTDDMVSALKKGGIIINGQVSSSGVTYNNPILFKAQYSGTGDMWGMFLAYTNSLEHTVVAQYRISQGNKGFGVSSYNWLNLKNIQDINGIVIEQFYKKPQSSVSLSDGGTISDNALKYLIQNEQPIKLNGFTCYFSCDDGTNYQYVSTRYDSNANKNHINVITINKSTWVATFHTSDLALN